MASVPTRPVSPHMIRVFVKVYEATVQVIKSNSSELVELGVNTVRINFTESIAKSLADIDALYMISVHLQECLRGNSS